MLEPEISFQEKLVTPEVARKLIKISVTAVENYLKLKVKPDAVSEVRFRNTSRFKLTGPKSLGFWRGENRSITVYVDANLDPEGRIRYEELLLDTFSHELGHAIYDMLTNYRFVYDERSSNQTEDEAIADLVRIIVMNRGDNEKICEDFRNAMKHWRKAAVHPTNPNQLIKSGNTNSAGLFEAAAWMHYPPEHIKMYDAAILNYIFQRYGGRIMLRILEIASDILVYRNISTAEGILNLVLSNRGERMRSIEQENSYEKFAIRVHDELGISIGDISVDAEAWYRDRKYLQGQQQ